MKIEELSNWLPEKIIQILREKGLEYLYPPQEDAIKSGLLDLRHSFVISVPTASGKTLIAEILMAKSLLERGGKCLYIVPLRALASEKLEEFKKYEKAGIKVGISTGDYDSADPWLARYDIIVATSEKADSLLRHRSGWLGEVNVLVADEIHLLHDAKRGPTLEVTIAKLKRLNPEIKILGLSATIKNAKEIAHWLDAKLIKSDWRPVPLKEGVYFGGEIFFTDSIKKVSKYLEEDLLNLAIETVEKKGQSLVFVSTRASAERFALNASKATKNLLSKKEEKILKKLSTDVLSVIAEPTKMCKRLGECIERGSAFHHAGLASQQRKIVEDAFKENLIKVLSATPTLAAGVNLPARRVVVRDYKRYEPGLGASEIPVLEIKQMFGRGGRPKYDKYGEALLVAKTEKEKSHLLDNYVLSGPESIYSKLAMHSALRMHTLATIATGFASSYEEVLDFFSNTFFAHQQKTKPIENIVDSVIRFLITEELVEKKRLYLVPTLFGKRTSELYIDPLSAIRLKEAILKAEKINTNDISYLHAISRTPELGGLYLRRKDYEICMSEAKENEEFLLFETGEDSWEFEEFLSEIKTALFLKDWIEEETEESIRKKYNLGPGDIRRKVELADWLLYSMQEIGRLFKAGKSKDVARIRLRVKHGVKKELLPLVSIKGIGRARARRLYRKGFRNKKDLKKASVKEISKVELIGKKIAIKIKEQLGEEGRRIQSKLIQG